MDLIYIFLILLSFGNQLPPIQPLGRFLLLNYQTSRCTINILPRDFQSSQIYQNLQKTHNNTTVQETPSETNELDGQPKVQVEFAKTAVEEVENWFPELYPYIPACNKEGECTAVILKFTPEQLQRDNGKAFEYLYHQELGQSKVVSSVEEAINSQGEKLIIATIDEETVLNGFYENLVENKETILKIACGVGILFGLFLAFFGQKALNLLLFVGGFSVTALAVNFWDYPGKINASNIGEPDFYQNLALVVGAGLFVGLLVARAQKVFLGVFLALVGVGAGAYFWYFVLNENEGFILFMFSVIAAGILFSLGEFLIKNYKEVTALSTGFNGAAIFGLSILAYFGVDITKQGFKLDLEDVSTRRMMFVFWLSFFVLIYGVKSQLGIKGRRKRIAAQGKEKGAAAGGVKTAAEIVQNVQKAAAAAGVNTAGGDKKQGAPEKLKNANLPPGKPGKRKTK